MHNIRVMAALNIRAVAVTVQWFWFMCVRLQLMSPKPQTTSVPGTFLCQWWKPQSALHFSTLYSWLQRCRVQKSHCVWKHAAASGSVELLQYFSSSSGVPVHGSSKGGAIIHTSRPLFQIFTESIDAIDVTSVTLSCLNIINAIDVTRRKLMLIECQIFQCSNDPMFKCFNIPMIQCSNMFFFSYGRKTFLSIGRLVHRSIGLLDQWSMGLIYILLWLLWHQLHWYCSSN